MNKKNKTLIICTLIASASLCYSQQFQVTFNVFDDSNKPLQGAAVDIFTYRATKIGEGFGEDVYKKVTGMTDSNGVAVLGSFNAHSDIKYNIAQLAGYYYSQPCDYEFRQIEDGLWRPWNPTIKLTLRKIGNPVPMYAKMPSLVLPELGRSVGYDLKEGDWVSPYGKGFIPDLVFRLDRKTNRTVKVGYYHREVKLFDATLTVSFSNPDDGIYAISTNEMYPTSIYKLPRTAPINGYQPYLVERIYRDNAQNAIASDFDSKQPYFYRIRTAKRGGNIISALYGKISGGINFDVINSPTAIITFAYYLNPTPNDQNMEFDSKQNLFKNLPSLEQVSAP